MDHVHFEGVADGGEAKVAYTARRLLDVGYGTLRPLRVRTGEHRPRRGDLVLCRVTGIGQHRFLGQRDGARSRLFPGDGVVVVYGDRYAPDQFEAVVPDHLGPCHLAAGGGIAATVVSRHASMLPPTALRPVGLVAGESGATLNLRALAHPLGADGPVRPPTVAVLGTSMNAGKSTAAASLVRGLVRAGRRVGAAKVTGTGAPGDPVLLADAGAACVVDFTDFGFPSTYRLEAAEVLGVLRAAVAHLARQCVDAIVLEVADGILQRETSFLLGTGTFRRRVGGVLFAAPDAVSAVAGSRYLAGQGLPVRAVGGVFTASPLAVAEAAELLEVPVYGSADLSEPAVAASVLTGAPAVPAARVPDRAVPQAPEPGGRQLAGSGVGDAVR
ncbi:DUF1611 domain-containing protein [Streptomyces sp. NPDC001380]|uniref:DUF1611 domain-containing protein n=1 Tax=Streptomyces sp. NPDC001380 TaxID=3364566 RepID=UPI0036993C8A